MNTEFYENREEALIYIIKQRKAAVTPQEIAVADDLEQCYSYGQYRKILKIKGVIK